jgi:hypothetical protein
MMHATQAHGNALPTRIYLMLDYLKLLDALSNHHEQRHRHFSENTCASAGTIFE